MPCRASQNSHAERATLGARVRVRSPLGSYAHHRPGRNPAAATVPQQGTTPYVVRHRRRRTDEDDDEHRAPPMELFERARTVRLRSHHDKYLYADEDESHVIQDRNAASPNARWVVEPVPHSPGVLRLRSRYGRYLSASNEPFLLGVTGRKVLQTLPHRLDSSVEWVPVRDDAAGRGGAGATRSGARLRTRYGNFLRANTGLPPWRNSVTHDTPHRHAGWVVWDVEIVQAVIPGPDSSATPAADDYSSAPPPSYKPPSRSSSPSPPPLPTSALMRPPPPPAHHREENSAPFRAQPPPPPPGYIAPPAPGLYRLEVCLLSAN